MPSNLRRGPKPVCKSRRRREAAERAVSSLLKWLHHHHHHLDQTSAANADDFIYLILALKTVPHAGRFVSSTLPLPHPLYSSVCLFTNQTNQNLLNSSPFPFSDVLFLSDLRSDYQSLESRHALAATHDLFVADSRTVSRLPELLGDPFYNKKKNKEPVVINLSRPTWPERLHGILRSTRFEMKGGNCSAIRVARASQGKDQIVGNVLAAVELVVGSVPNKWDNVKSLHIKSAESLALPIYQTKELEKDDSGVENEEKDGDGVEIDEEEEEGETEDEVEVRKAAVAKEKRKLKKRKIVGKEKKVARVSKD